MKKEIMVAILVLFGAVAGVFAQDINDLHGTVGVTYDTKYVWRGIVVYGSQSAIHPFIDLDLMGSGFHLEVVGHRANSSGFEELERWDYSLYYMNALNPGDTWETRYMVGYRYFNYPQQTSHRAYKSATDLGSFDLQEVYAGLSFPKVLGVQGLVPTYVLLKTWPSNSGTLVGAANPNGGSYAGCAHVFMLDYALPVAGFTAETPEQILNFHIETVFNDGVDPRPTGGYTDSDWTHALVGVSTDFDLGSNVTLTPGLYHQVTMEDDKESGVSPDHDITWASATLKYKF